MPGAEHGTGTMPVAGGQGRAGGGKTRSGAKLNEENSVKAAATSTLGQCHGVLLSCSHPWSDSPAVTVPRQP